VNVAKPLQQDVPINLEVIGEDARQHGDRGYGHASEGFIETVEFEAGQHGQEG
jgi:hypothetical protein